MIKLDFSYSQPITPEHIAEARARQANYLNEYWPALLHALQPAYPNATLPELQMIAWQRLLNLCFGRKHAHPYVEMDDSTLEEATAGSLKAWLLYSGLAGGLPGFLADLQPAIRGEECWECGDYTGDESTICDRCAAELNEGERE